MKKIFLNTILMLLFVFPLYANPNTTLDSLMGLLNSNISVQNRIKTHLDIADILYSTSSEDAITHLRTAAKLSQDENQKENLALSLFKLYQIQISNPTTTHEANKNLEEAITLCKQYKYDDLYKTILEKLLANAEIQQNYDSAITYASEIIKYTYILDDAYFKYHLEVARFYNLQKQHEKSTKYLRKILILLEHSKKYELLYAAYKRISNNDWSQNQYTLAFNNMKIAHQYAYLAKNEQLISEGYYFLGVLSIRQDSTQAFKYFDEAIALARNIPKQHVLTRLLVYTGTIYCSEEISLHRIKSIYKELCKIEDLPSAFQQNLLLIDIYISKRSNQYEELFEKAQIYISKTTEINFLNVEIFVFYLTEKIRQQAPSYITYIEKYLEIKKNFLDIIQNHFFSLEEQYKSHQRSSHIANQELALSNIKLMDYIYIFSSIIIILLAIFLVVNFKLKKKHAYLEQYNTVLKMQEEINALELSMLNKQLDPNEIKNLIDNIAPEIQEHVPETYEKMTKLFNITHASLNNSISESLLLQLEQAQDFINLNKKTLSYPLEYQINNQVHHTDVELPRLLLKNIVENAIKHGIKPKKDAGLITINLIEIKQAIEIKIIDNGVSNTQNKSEKTDSTGIGFIAYKKLFKLLNKHNRHKAFLDIEFFNTGSTVTIIMPINYTYSI